MKQIPMFLLVNLKTTLMLVASIFIFPLMMRELRISLTESAPTPVNINRWNDYHQQQWISLTGFADKSLGAVASTTEFIPVVPDNFQPGDPIRAVIISNPNYSQQFSGPVTVEGEVARPGVWDLKRVMPGNVFDANVICLNEGTTPDGLGTPVFMMSLALVLVSVAALRLRSSAREFFPPRKATNPYGPS